MFSHAEAYERFMGRWSRLLARSFVAFADVRDARDILDVGSGTGALTAALREASGTAHIIGVDPAAPYVEEATRKIDDARVRFQVGDATRLDFEDGSFDAALSALVLSFVPDLEAAVREMVRVTKPDGVVAAAVWDYAGGMQMLRVFWDEAVAADASAKAFDEARLPLSREGELGTVLRAVGLEAVREEPLTIRLRFASFDDYWSPFLLGQGPAGAHAAKLAPDARSALEERLRRRLVGDRSADAPFELDARAWAARGTVPRRPG